MWFSLLPNAAERQEPANAVLNFHDAMVSRCKDNRRVNCAGLTESQRLTIQRTAAYTTFSLENVAAGIRQVSGESHSQFEFVHGSVDPEQCRASSASEFSKYSSIEISVV